MRTFQEAMVHLIGDFLLGGLSPGPALPHEVDTGGWGCVWAEEEPEGPAMG